MHPFRTHLSTPLTLLRFAETHQSETEAELLEMEVDPDSRDSEAQGRFSSAMSSIKDLGSAVTDSRFSEVYTAKCV